MSLDIGDHQFISLLGPSGCGKSTVLKMISDLLPRSSGEISWSDQTDINSTKEHSHDIGYVFQEPTLMPWANIFDNTYLPLKLQGINKSKAENRVVEVLETVGLGKFQNSYPHELSGGMKMRASIARALVTRPKVMLMDEPFAALDEITRFKLNNDVLDLWQKHKLTVIFVTHSVFESVYLSNRIVVMASRPGRVVEEIAVDAAYPRGEEFRTSAEYANYCREVSQALHKTLHIDDLNH